MTCPVCGARTTVIDTASADVECVYRMRKCKDCEYKFYTIETECNNDNNENIRKIYNKRRRKKNV